MVTGKMIAEFILDVRVGKMVGQNERVNQGHILHWDCDGGGKLDEHDDVGYTVVPGQLDYR